jgi:hypothetical protein
MDDPTRGLLRHLSCTTTRVWSRLDQWDPETDCTGHQFFYRACRRVAVTRLGLGYPLSGQCIAMCPSVRSSNTPESTTTTGRIGSPRGIYIVIKLNKMLQLVAKKSVQTSQWLVETRNRSWDRKKPWSIGGPFIINSVFWISRSCHEIQNRTGPLSTSSGKRVTITI